MHKWLLSFALLVGVPAAQAADGARVIALGGDVTEVVYALGAGDELVAVDSTSIWPAAARALPDVGYVRQLGAEGIVALRPTLVIATHDVGPPTVVSQLRDAGIDVQVVPETRTPAQIAAKVRSIGALLDRRAAAEALASAIERQAQTLQTKVAAMKTRPRTVFVMSAASGALMVAGRGTAADAAIALAGGDNVVRAYSGYKPLTPESLIALKPDVLLLMDTGGGVDADALLAQPAVAQTPAGRARRVIAVDGQALLGFSMRTVDDAAKLQARLAALDAP
ncbi:heme/hemin ABC transporter substrate-binding protein [Solimonas marina]|uniref:ABC transporter substrate-binding protein n=1 Tax=Solimonas marina TaxID=2714601 RepID=A0A969W8I1_9GAMM|nr:ABC transporter substrate-binding protein [Solimonas marina]NKF22362.1 ABC transporter substrate-binding protein [Solimonas marina]